MPSSHRSAALGFIFITLLLDVLGIGIIVPVLPKLVETLFGGDSEKAAYIYGPMVASYCIMQFLCSPILGRLSDRFGRRPVILFALLGSGLDYFLVAVVAGETWSWVIPLLFLARLIAGATAGNISAATAYIADISKREDRSANFGLVGVAFGIGFVIGPVLGGFLGEVHPKLPFIVAGFLTLLNCLYGLVVLPESLSPEKRRPFKWSEANPVASFRGLRRSTVLFGLAVATFFLNISHYVYHSVWVLFTGLILGWSEFDVGLSLAAFGVMSAFVQGYVGRILLPRWGEWKILGIALPVIALEMVGFSFANQGWHLYALIIFGSLGGLANPALRGLMSNEVEDDEQGWLQGALTGIESLAGSFAPIMLGSIFGFFVGPTLPAKVPGAPFTVSAILVGIAGFLIFRLCRRSRPE